MYAYKIDIPDASCEQYVVKDLDHVCSDIKICIDCTWAIPPIMLDWHVLIAEYWPFLSKNCPH